jgi:hypothetical protein
MRVLLRAAGFRDSEVTPIGPVQACEPLDAAPATPVFRFRRGKLEERAANVVAGALYRLGAGADYFPQMEIWATA